MSKVKKATLISDALSIRYAQALRLLREVRADHDMGLLMDLPDLIHACRELKEKQDRASKSRPRKDPPSDKCLCDPKMAMYCHSTECHGGSEHPEDGR